MLARSRANPAVKHTDEVDGPSVLFVVPSDYASLEQKGVVYMILERDEGGFFQRVITAHPWATLTRLLDLNEAHQVREFGPEFPFRIPMGLLRLPLAVMWRLMRPVSILWQLTRVIGREEIRVLRATDPYWCGFYAWVLSKLTHVPFCVSIHADYDMCYRLSGRTEGTPRILKRLENFVLRRAHLTMPIREHLAKKAIKAGADPGRVRIIPHGVDTSFFSPGASSTRERLGIPAEKKILSFAGRLSCENYVSDIIELAVRLRQKRDDFVLIMTGDGPERSVLEAAVRDQALCNSVRFTGFQDHQFVADMRRASSAAMCLMGGLSLIEACSTGCAVVAYDVEWHYELVRNGETGFLIAEHDIDALVRRVGELLDDPQRAQAMGARARQMAVARHETSHTSEVKRSCYRELLASRAKSCNED
jgi:glycogen synthase